MDMADDVAVNGLYIEYLTVNPPTRVEIRIHAQ